MINFKNHKIDLFIIIFFLISTTCEVKISNFEGMFLKTKVNQVA